MQGTEIGGVDIHFLHLRSPHQGALPLIMTTAGRARSSSRSPTRPPTAAAPPTPSTWCCRPSPATASPTSRPSSAGQRPHRARLGRADGRLGSGRYVAQGGDVGAVVTDNLGRRAPAGLLGIHLNLLVPALAAPMPTNTDEERAAAAALAAFNKTGSGQVVEQARRPQRIG